jgi:NAD(P)H-nitrite reductase large subunit
MAILPGAYMQVKSAGINMAGGKNVFDTGIPMNSIGFFGIHIMTAGTYPTAEEGGELYEERGEDTLKRLFIKDGKLAGFILIGRTERAGIYTKMVREGTPLSEVDFELVKKEPALFPFGADYRGKILGGVV